MNLLLSSWALCVTAYAVFLVAKEASVESEKDALTLYVQTLEDELNLYEPGRPRAAKEKGETRHEFA
jgi:hypothetical protein